MDVKQTEYRASRLAGYGVLGGISGAIVMGGMAYMMPIPNTGGAPFFVALAMMMGAGGMAAAGGWTLHLLIGTVIGVIFGAIVSKSAKLRLTNIGKGIGLGILGGIVWWVIAFVPAMAVFMPALMSMGDIVAGSFAAHGVYGLVLGGVVGALAQRSGEEKILCEACGGTFSTREELTEHAKVHEKPAQQFKCDACGGTFRSQAELMEHAKKTHQKLAQQFTCKSCGGVFKSEAELMEHAKKAHPMPSTH